MKKLTDKQQHFIQEYLIDSNMARAYEAAGYSAKQSYKNAHALLQQPHIKSEVSRLQKETSLALNLKKEDLILDLLEIKDDNKSTSPNTSVKCIEVLNKMLGFDAPQQIEHKMISINYINPNKDDKK